jgi:hypothetical protein
MPTQTSFAELEYVSKKKLTRRELRAYVVQEGFGLADEGLEDALYDRQAIRRFGGTDLAREGR